MIRSLLTPARAIALGALTALATLTAPALAAGPEPIEHELFESWVGRYSDMTRQQLFARHGVEAPSTRRLPFDVSRAKFYREVVDGLSLDRAAQKTLARHGVLLVDPPRRYSMAAAYWELFTSDLPLLVTTDSILDAMHRSFDSMLAELEAEVFSPMIREVLSQTRDAAVALAATEPALGEAADDVDLYLTVALNLLEADPGATGLRFAPKRVAEATVLELLSKVGALQLENPGVHGTGPTVIYGAPRAVDWSQFKPRGHYTRQPELQRYFRAMMWLGRADTGFEPARPRQLRAAALISHAARTSGALATLGKVKSAIDLFVGRSDELTPFQLAELMQRMKLTPADLTTDAALAPLAEQLAASGMGAQRIRSQLVVSDPESPQKAVLPPLFQLFGQRFVIDSFVMSKVVYDDIVFEGQKMRRRMPTGLDVMAALGNDLALWLSKDELDRWQYGANMTTLRDIIGAYTDDHWSDSLYMLWLDVLRSLDDTPEGHLPAVMKRGAWGRKMLQTQLASWSQLRHNTILYAKQSYTVSVGCLYPAGYVEPYPLFYARLERFARAASQRLGALRGFGEHGQLIQRHTQYFDGFAGHMQTLETLARKQLKAQRFSKDEEAFLRNTIEMKLVGGYDPTPQWNGWYMDLIYIPRGGDVEDATKWEPTIADVHTDPDAGRALEVGTGDVHFVVAAIDNDGDTALHVGPSFTYYSFTEPVSNRLTDQQWQQRLASDNAPPRPAWIRDLVVEGTPQPPKR